jgi:NAD(P)H-dependent flavin oxidoreductase YrpB (nitropropane dioxygenase family)
VIKNQLSEEWQKLEERGAFPEEIKAEKIVSAKITSGDVEKIPLMAGLAAGGIKEIKSCQEIIDEIVQYLANLHEYGHELH